MFISVIISLSNGNDSALAALSISFVMTFVSGIFPFIFVRKVPVITLHDGYMIIVLSWLLSFVFGMMPYLLWGGPFTLENAWFESVSGFTTTGATILETVENLPDSLLFWRSSTHFIGGLGVVVFLLLIIPSSSPIKLKLTNMEVSSLSKDTYKTRTNKTIKIFTLTYCILVAVCALCFKVAGMNVFDSVNHAFSIIATGGFSTKSLSIAYYESKVIEIVSVIFMFISSLHFGLIYYSFVTRSLTPLKKSPVVRIYTGIIIFSSLIIAFYLHHHNVVSSWAESFHEAFFYVVSYISSTGLAISELDKWPLFPCVLLMMLSLMCGCAGSTTGGIKADRVLIMFKSFRKIIHKVLHPSSVEQVKIGNHVVKEDEITTHFIFMVLYLVLVFVSTLLCLASGSDLSNAFFGSISMVGNVGPALENLGGFGNYGLEPTMAKIIYTADMFFGRIEIFPILAVASMLYGKIKK